MMYSNAKYDKSDEVLAELGVNVTKNKEGSSGGGSGGTKPSPGKK